MKSRMLLVGLLGCFIFLASCKKNVLPFVKPNLRGSWELRKIQGGFFGPAGAPDVRPGNGNILKFSRSMYRFYFRGQLTGTGTYTIGNMDTYGGEYPKHALFLNSNPYPEARFSIRRNTLTMYAGSIAADGTIAEYVRQ
jgi:hypothetical protein